MPGRPSRAEGSGICCRLIELHREACLAQRRCGKDAPSMSGSSLSLA